MDTSCCIVLYCIHYLVQTVICGRCVGDACGSLDLGGNDLGPLTLSAMCTAYGTSAELPIAEPTPHTPPPCILIFAIVGCRGCGAR
jgi:hypothetical protein